MKLIEQIHKDAINHTKTKIMEDLNLYLGKSEEIPLIEDYLSERRHYIEQIWVNVWLNKATNNISKQEKIHYLNEKGFETENVARKLINHTFRNEMRTYHPFNSYAWINEKYRNANENWRNQYENARIDFLRKEKEEFLRKEMYRLQDMLEETAIEIIEKNEELLYLHIRQFTGIQLASDMKSRTRYAPVDTFALEERLEEIGAFEKDAFLTVSSFFNELTGDIHKTIHEGRNYFEYETYYDRYERLIAEYLIEILPKIVIEQLPETINDDYKRVFSESISKSMIERILDFEYGFVANDLIEIIQEEYVSDLLKLSTIPFDFKEHRYLYEEALADRERKIAEEHAEIERKKAAEQRMLDDIFGQEYRPAVERNIRYTLHIGETNTGKTHHALERMKAADSGLYLAPLRLLALEVYDKLNQEGTPCSLKTGEEEKLVSSANHISCTVEMFHEKEIYDCIVIDEAQMLNDKDRGFSWYKAITKAHAKEVHIIGSWSAKEMILQLLGEADIEIFEYNRDIPLEVEKKEFKINQVKKGDALICFSRKRVLETASRLENARYSVSMIYGSMPPETRKKQVQRFINGETSVIVSTDAIGMGLNLPIRRIVFLENEKFDGTKRRLLTSQEVKQIAGRAGRKGIYDVGKVAFISDIRTMKRLLDAEDRPVQTFSVAPTNTIFERFQKYYHDLGTFFELWEKFESPNGTKKATLSEERELYNRIRGTEIEARLSITDLYGFLHLPFAKKEADLIWQWEQTMYAILNNTELPEPRIKKRTLEELELSYKAIGLHLLFLYRLDQRVEALYWERLREEISDHVHERLKTDVKNMTKKCRRCGEKLPWEHEFQICDNCHYSQSRRRYWE
ncbi:ATP-dependent RNA helicase SUPV3L1/SUV3 [Cytobacillus eiseniae]|uniref:ATP-dependent RNA helicase SUPV3L1/SUV3 n=1 Tax=Cytobacillus eiseniae TaxID=762947 RepID=A0ABS4RA84_9BACI|nr:helicase-related protein [Cytobacillus eiseniae]MBP2239799.1 ATP-dependent RNA helicase SUPV3L1/SUV3 [Cytobacillus eiseniae]